MSAIAKTLAGVLTAVGIAQPVYAAAAQTDRTVYFSYRDVNCAVTEDGTVGCDFAEPVYIVSGGSSGLSVRHVVIDAAWLPAHPTFEPGTPYTLSGGNPAMPDVIDYAGAHCEIRTTGFACDAKTHHFSYAWFPSPALSLS